MTSRSIIDIALETALIVGGFGLAAFVSGAGFFVGLGVLVLTGFVLGFLRGTRWVVTLLGSALGGVALVLFFSATAWRSAPDLGSGLLFGLIAGGAFVLPGFLLGRATRLSEASGSGAVEGADGVANQASGPSARTYAISGCLILLVVAVAMFLILRALLSMGY